MDGLAGRPGWAWIFIVEGLITILVGIVSWWVIVDFPSDATFLTEEEKKIVRLRLEGDGQHGARDEKFKWSEFKASFSDWKTWTGMVMYMGVDGALYAFSLFLPSIIFEMGYKTLQAQLMSVAPYAFACVLVKYRWIWADGRL
jgi:nitrate/nitrite transporter NarK